MVGDAWQDITSLLALKPAQPAPLEHTLARAVNGATCVLVMRMAPLGPQRETAASRRRYAFGRPVCMSLRTLFFRPKTAHPRRHVLTTNLCAACRLWKGGVSSSVAHCNGGDGHAAAASLCREHR
jgi:hypothetical protein